MGRKRGGGGGVGRGNRGKSATCLSQARRKCCWRCEHIFSCRMVEVPPMEEEKGRANFHFSLAVFSRILLDRFLREAKNKNY